MKRVLGFVAVALTCLASAPAAQSNKGGISGTVFDESGGVVAAAQVVVTNIGTGESRQITTSGAGSFAVPLLEPAEYRVTVDAPGFKKTVLSSVKVDTAPPPV